MCLCDVHTRMLLPYGSNIAVFVSQLEAIPYPFSSGPANGTQSTSHNLIPHRTSLYSGPSNLSSGLADSSAVNLPPPAPDAAVTASKPGSCCGRTLKYCCIT